MAAVTSKWPSERRACPLFIKRKNVGCQGIARVQPVVTAEVETAAAELIRAGAGGDRHHRVQCMSVLRVELTAIDLELLHGVLPDVDRRAAPLCVIDVAAVDDGRVAAALIGGAAKPGDRE